MKNNFLTAAKKALFDTINHDGIEHAGYLAFLSILGIFPFMVLLVAAASFVGASEVGRIFLHIIIRNSILPAEAFAALQPQLHEIISGPPEKLLTLALIGALWTASSMIEGLRTILNRAYRVDTPPAYIWRRLLSIVQFLMLMSVLVILMILIVVIPIILEFLFMPHVPTLPSSIASLLDNFRQITTAFILFIAVACSYYFIPNLKQSWRNVLPGTIATLIGWISAADLLAFYISDFHQMQFIYGSLGGIIAALLFFYIGGMIYIFGAEWNYHLQDKEI
jgi:membrane protein